MKKIIFLISLYLFCNQITTAQIKLKHKTPPPQMESLQFLVGKWHTGNDQWYDANGKPLKIERDKSLSNKKKVVYEIAPIMHGLYLEGGAKGDMVRSYFYYNEREKKYYHLAIDFMGSTSIMTGQWEGETLVLTDIHSQPHPDGGTIMWRRKLSKTDNSDFLSIYEASLDEGKSWKMRGKQTMGRADKVKKNQDIPKWLLEDWAERANNNGIWITDNTSYKSDNEPYDAYGLKWEYGLGKKHLKGRLYCIKDGKDAGTVWQFTEYWNPSTAEVHIVQIGNDGTVGQGSLWQEKDGSKKEQQTFVSPGGGSFETRHHAWMENGEKHTESYNIVDGEWVKRRFYVWKQKEEPFLKK